MIRTIKKYSRKEQKKHPFGVHLGRFKTTGLHPCLLRTVDNGTTPCDYDPTPPHCIRDSNIFGWEPWRTALESEEYSKNLGYEHADLMEYKRFMRGHLGPGSHDIDPQVYKQATVSPCLNQNFGKQRRIPKIWTISPGPARYNIRPYSMKIHHEGNTLGRSKKFADYHKSWYLACNRYKVIDPHGIDALTRKFCSIRGPYDPFTGPRDPQNIYNKFSISKFAPDKYYMWPSDLDNFLHHSTNQKKGKFKKSERFLPKPVNRHMINDLTAMQPPHRFPGPAHYVIGSSITGCEQAMYGFAITGMDVRPSKKWAIAPGPGRYNIHPLKCTPHKNRTSVFLSKTGRTEYKSVTYNAF